MSSLNSDQLDSLIEKGLLASIFEEPESILAVSNILEPGDFLEPRHELIYKAILGLHADNKKFDLIKVADTLNTNGDLSKAGGTQYFMELADPDTIYSVDDPLDYALRVKEKSRKRQLSIASLSINEKTLPGSGYDADDGLAYAQEMLHKLSQTSNNQEIQRIGDLLEETFDEIEEKSRMEDGVALGVPTGFIDLDACTTGFLPGQMIILAARPAMGKTTLALDFARGASLLAGKSTIFFSLEMGRGEVVQKILAAEAKIELEKIKKGKLTAEEWEKLAAAAVSMKDSNLMIDDTPELSMVNLRAKCLKKKASPEGLDFVVIDYLQLMKVPDAGSDGRQVAVSEMSRGIKLLAKELGVPVVILSQLNRAVENRNDKIPLPSDLRESGSLEQDADIIMFVHRPEYYDPNDQPGQAQIIIAKHRGGPTRTIPIIPLLEFSKFANGQGKFASLPTPTDEPPAEDSDPFDQRQVNVPPEFAGSPQEYTPAEPDGAGPAW